MTPQELLQSTVDYYSVDPKTRRCIDATGDCTYSPKTTGRPESEGCAIGRHLSPEIQEYFDSISHSVTIHEIFKKPKLKEKLPDWMQQMDATFLRGVQSLHDDNLFWVSDGGLTNAGVEYIRHLQFRFGLEHINIPSKVA